MIKFPYGIRDFEKLIDGQYVYIDRTHHIRFLEEWGHELLFMRPRRFGKSLWLSTLMNYYDVNTADEFDQLFGHLAIGQEPTPLHNQYLVMRWDFSKVAVSGSIDDIQESLSGHINGRIVRFYDFYKHLLQRPIKIYPDAMNSFEELMTVVALSGYRLYLFIDEYDNFANEVLMVPKAATERETDAQRQRYVDLVKGEGLFKTLFKNLKSAGSGDGLERIFMTGVSPIVLSDVTSGANTFKNISWRENLNDLCGFTHQELLALTTQLLNTPEMQAEIEDPEIELTKMMTLMENYYDGSLFIEDFRKLDMDDLPKIYNPTLTFYFLEEFQAKGNYPLELLDENLTPDDHKLAHIVGYEAGPPLLDDAFAGDRQITVRTLRQKFGVRDLLNVDLQQDHLAVLLCHLGALTCVGGTKTGRRILEIPNLVIRQLYSERVLVQRMKSDDTKVRAAIAAADLLFETGNIASLCAFAQKNLLDLYRGRDALDFNELTLKTIFMMLLYHTDMYLIDSEVQIVRRFGDLLMLLRPGMRYTTLCDILIEFKHLHLSETTEDVPTKSGGTKREALKGEEVQARSAEELMVLPNVKAKFDEAQNQLADYRQKLVSKHGEELDLRCFAVVSIGFERILWKQLIADR